MAFRIRRTSAAPRAPSTRSTDDATWASAFSRDPDMPTWTIAQSMLFDGEGFVAPRRPGDRIDGYLFCYAA